VLPIKKKPSLLHSLMKCTYISDFICLLTVLPLLLLSFGYLYDQCSLFVPFPKTVHFSIFLVDPIKVVFFVSLEIKLMEFIVIILQIWMKL
jgi:hypothetical protein